MYNPQIETFIKVADAGSFNKAAVELYITPTAVIKQINLLESSLNLVVFEHTHRGLILNLRLFRLRTYSIFTKSER